MYVHATEKLLACTVRNSFRNFLFYFFVQVQSPKRQRKAPKQGVVCDVCELVVKFLKPYVDSNSTEVSG